MVDHRDLKVDRGRLIKEMRQMLEASEKENRAFTPEEQTKYDALKVQQEDLGRRADIAERQLALNALETTSPETRTAPRIEVGNDLAGTRPFSSFGEQLMCIRRAAEPGGRLDPRLEMRASGMAESPTSDGGFLVVPEYSAELLKRAYGAGVLASMVRRIPVQPQTSILKIPYINESSRVDGSRWGGIQAYWTDEAAAMPGSKPAVGLMTLALKKLTGLCYATDELLQDTSALEAVISQGFAEEMSFKLDDALVNGDGSGKPMGILNATCTVSVAKESQQTATTVNATNVLKMWSRCYGRSRGNAVWLINQDVEPMLHSMYISTGTYSGAPIYLPANGVSASPYSTLFGRPVIPVEYCPTLGTVGDIILADLSQMVLIDRSVQAASSIHVRFIYDESVFRFVYRVDAQPAWAAALTPYKGSSTVSPFVTLATRS